MQRPPKPDNEPERMRALHRYQILDTAPEAGFNDLVAIAAAICGVPMGSVSLIDDDRQWFKARIGLGVQQTPRDTAFCAHAILNPREMMVVPDARDDARFRGNPLVLGDPNIRFYAGAPLLSQEGLAMGALCVMDSQNRELQPHQADALTALSRQVSALLELRQLTHALAMQLQERDWYEQQLQKFSEALELHNADLSEQVRLDALTGLANRRALVAALEHALASARSFCVALLDIDHFKAVNDTHGHPVGDEVLVRVADALRASSAGHGVLARHGGEEFAWLMPGVDLQQARLQCEYLREAVAFTSGALPVTVSIGVSDWRAGDTVASLLTRADHALYAAKRAGRNQVMLG